MGFQDLADVHSARHAERVQHDVDRATVGQVRHVFHRHDARDNTLVAVASRHLVADLQLALTKHVHLDQARDTGRKFVAARDALDFLLVLDVDALDGLGRGVEDDLDLTIDLGVLHDGEAPLQIVEVELLEELVGDLAAGLGDDFAGLRVDEFLARLADHQTLELLAAHRLDALDVLVARLLELGQTNLVLAARFVVAFLAREDFDADHDAVHARRRLQATRRARRRPSRRRWRATGALRERARFRPWASPCRPECRRL